MLTNRAWLLVSFILATLILSNEALPSDRVDRKTRQKITEMVEDNKDEDEIKLELSKHGLKTTNEVGIDLDYDENDQKDLMDD